MKSSLVVLAVSQTLLLGGILLLYPRITRKGLLFGAYVGEEIWDGPEARRITAGWYRAMIAVIVASVLVALVGPLMVPSPALTPVPVLLLVTGFFVFYIRAYRQALALTDRSAIPPPAVAPLEVVDAPSPLIPAAALAASVACGVFAIAYCWAHYGAMPARVPTHFGFSGEPDAWRPRSFWTVMMLPILTLVMGIGMAGLAWLTAHAKRALRASDQGRSLAAQLRFRTAVSRWLAAIAFLVTLALAGTSVSAARVALGLDPGLHLLARLSFLAVVAVALGGTIYLALRYGQGGSRIERAGTDTPLTDGLADNRHWVLGLFYVNRDDPSYVVEHRFGFGYTINLGNWKAVAFLGGFIALILALPLIALITG